MNEHAQAAARFAALASARRVLICHVLEERGGTLTVDELVDVLKARGMEISQATLSHHLGVLYRAGLIEYQGSQYHYYRIAPQGFRWLTAYLAPFLEGVPV